MFKRILLPTDGSPLAERAAAYGLKLAAATGARAVALYASPPFETPTGFEFVPTPLVPVELYEKSAKAAAERYLGAIAKRAEKAGVACETVHVRSLAPEQAIVETATARRCDLVVIGSHGYGGFKQLFLGSVTTRVLATSTVPVLVHRDPKR